MRTEPTMNEETKALLRQLAERYETADFLRCDPSQFMHHYTACADQEVVAFIASCLSFGQRKQFLKKIELIEQSMNGQPALWIKERRYATDKLFAGKSPAESFYRMVTYGDLMALFDKMAGDNIFELQQEGKIVCNTGTIQEHWATPHLVPCDPKSTCKRLHMFMRWMVRVDSPVDLGLWSEYTSPASLTIPLDVHVCQEAVRLGLIERPTMSLATARRITEQARTIFPDDPARLDFALFGLGVDENRTDGLQSSRCPSGL